MAPEMLGGFMMCSTTRRARRQFTHMVSRAEKKETKRLRAGRAKKVRSFVRFTTHGFIIRIGNDLEIYEPEVVRLAREEVEEINLFYDFYGYLDEEDYDLFPNINLSLDDDFGDI